MTTGIQNLRRWHWIVIALAVGILVGSVRQFFPDDLPSRYRLTSSDRAEFERALAEKVDGVPRLSNLFVYPARIPGTGEPLDIVIGAYLYIEDNVWKSAAKCYVFRPADPGSGIVEYLRQQNIPYRYAWWRLPGPAIALWVVGSLLVIGGIWPTVLNLVAYGQLTQPPRETFAVGPATAPSAASAPALTDEELARIAAMASALENDLTQHASPAAGSAPAPETPPARQLSDAPLQLAPVDSFPDAREFGADPDDFYPTERHVPPRAPPSPHR